MGEPPHMHICKDCGREYTVGDNQENKDVIDYCDSCIRIREIAREFQLPLTPDVWKMIPGKWYQWIGNPATEDSSGLQGIRDKLLLMSGIPFKLMDIQSKVNSRTGEVVYVIWVNGDSDCWHWDAENAYHFQECESPVMEGGIQ
jgi:hypothetical protein